MGSLLFFEREVPNACSEKVEPMGYKTREDRGCCTWPIQVQLGRQKRAFKRYHLVKKNDFDVIQERQFSHLSCNKRFCATYHHNLSPQNLHYSYTVIFKISSRLRDNFPVDESDRCRIHSDENGNTKIVIREAQISDSGLYFCAAENKAGKAKCAATFRVVGELLLLLFAFNVLC